MLRLLRVELYRNSRRVIVLALLAVYLFLALSGAFKFFSRAQGMYVQQMQTMYQNQYQNDPERLTQEMRTLWKVVYSQCLLTNDQFCWIIVPGVLGIYLTVDMRKRRISEMFAAGNSKLSIFSAKSLCYALLCAAIPVFCGLLHFWLHPATYSGYLYASDFGYLLYNAGYMFLFYFFFALQWLPMNYLCGEPISGLITSFFFNDFIYGELPYIFHYRPVDANNVPGNEFLYYLVGDVSRSWGIQNMVLVAIEGVFSILLAWVIFRWRPMK